MSETILWHGVGAIVLGLLVALVFLRVVAHLFEIVPKDSAWIMHSRSPLAYILGSSVLWACLSDHPAFQHGPGVACSVVVFLGLSFWIWSDLRATVAETNDEKEKSVEPTFLMLTMVEQAVLLTFSYSVLVHGTAESCWIWIITASIFILALPHAMAQRIRMVREDDAERLIPRKKEELSIQGRIAAACIPFLIVAYVSICSIRNAITEHYGVPVPRAAFEMRSYDTIVQIEIQAVDRDFGLREYDGSKPKYPVHRIPALAHVLSKGRFWGRFRHVQIKSFSFTKGHTHHVRSQEDTIGLESDAYTLITTTIGLRYLVTLTNAEEVRLRP